MKVEEKNGKIFIDGIDVMGLLSKTMLECDKLQGKLNELSKAILNETTTFCNECASKDCCPERECVLYRIEELASNERE